MSCFVFVSCPALGVLANSSLLLTLLMFDWWDYCLILHVSRPLTVFNYCLLIVSSLNVKLSTQRYLYLALRAWWVWLWYRQPSSLYRPCFRWLSVLWCPRHTQGVLVNWCELRGRLSSYSHGARIMLSSQLHMVCQLYEYQLISSLWDLK
jgi:hypothetical protein